MRQVETFKGTSVFFLPVILLAAAGGVMPARAANAQPYDAAIVFGRANALYKEGRYGEAIRNYEDILTHELAGGNLYYNLANSYYKNGSAGKAVLNYERAGIFIPRDADMKSNYEYVRSGLSLGAPQLSGMRLLRVNDAAWSHLTLDGLTVVMMFLYILALAGIFFKPAAGKNGVSRRADIVIIGSLVLGIMVSCAFARRLRYYRRAAVVLASQIEAKFAPVEGATAHFTLSEGSIVEIIEENQGYARIRRGDGKIGWAKAGSIERVVR